MAVASDMVISVAVLVRESTGKSIALIQKLRECSPDINRLVDFTLVFTDPTHEYEDYIDPATGQMRAFNDIVKRAAETFTKHDCKSATARGMSLLQLGHGAFEYPTAAMQRIARKAVSTEYVLPMEIDMVPSVVLCAFAKQELAANDVSKLHSHGAALAPRAFVVPSLS
jgi:hypothetical protein